MSKAFQQNVGLTVASAAVRVDLLWPEFKKYLDGTFKTLSAQCVETASDLQAFAIDHNVVYVCVFAKTPGDFDETFTTQELIDEHDAQRTDFETNFKPKSNQPLIKTDEDGNRLQVTEPRQGTELILVTHNFCDPTTWYTESGRVTDEGLSDSGDGLTWESAHPNWIDMTHGKVFDEDSLSTDVAHGYSVVVKVDAVTMTPRAPFATSGGDYTVDYKLGKITFAADQSGKTVTADYSYATTSNWRLEPLPGTRIDIESAEAQFSLDVGMNSAIMFDIYAYNPMDLPNKVLIAQTAYKKMSNIIDEAQGGYPVIKACGGSIRGLQNDIYGFPFRYGTVRKVLSSYGIELRVHVSDDIPFDGEHATATFYCTVKPE